MDRKGEHETMLRHARADTANLQQNERHTFAARYTLAAYKQGIVCNYIPKNACSTLRFSFAVANGFLGKDDDPQWIHLNNDTLAVPLRDLLTADYTFVMLRCPYRRLVSAFLNKAVDYNRDREPLATFRHTRAQQLRKWLGGRKAFYGDLTFRSFCQFIAQSEQYGLDEHWRKQVDFLVYKDYSDVLQFEDSATAFSKIEERGLEIIDTRNRLNHHTSRFEKLEGAFADMPVKELKKLRRENKAPTAESLYDPEIRGIVERVYADDLALYKAHFGASSLLFND
ncbi:MAG: sulfotransferase family 2 domain-containing protein [Pseudomonadota bacterium]